jgi:hypothetical protein
MALKNEKTTNKENLHGDWILIVGMDVFTGKRFNLWNDLLPTKHKVAI